jgi:hypothetical protein
MNEIMSNAPEKKKNNATVWQLLENPMKSFLSDFWISEFSKSTVTAKQSSTITVGIYTLSRCFYEWIRW